MGCNCGGGSLQASQQTPEPEYEIRYPDGTTKIVKGEHEAKVAATIGEVGTTYTRR